MDQTNVQRVLGARAVEDGQKGAILAGFLKLLPGVSAGASGSDSPRPLYLNSFLHRSFVVWVFAAVVMVGVSLVTRPAATEKVHGHVFAWPSEP